MNWAFEGIRQAVSRRVAALTQAALAQVVVRAAGGAVVVRGLDGAESDHSR